ncbi:Transposable element Tc3 transposase, partial [Camponotus floridanus]
LNFAIEHQNWDMHDWSRVLFTDESRFCLKVPDGRHRVYRRPGERFAPCTVKARENFYSGSIMVWAGISADAHTDLHFFERNMDSYIYIEDIIIPYIVPYKEFIGENFLLMQDNARPHVARVVTNFLNEINIERMVWPAISPDMNPIEHLWDILKRRVQKHNAQTLAALRNALQEEWNNLKQEEIRNLI